MTDNKILLGYATQDKTHGAGVYPVHLNLKRANRHGLIAGATGTGKTVSLQALAESFSQQGVPVFVADIKGDVSGISQAGKSHPKDNERLQALGLPADQWRGCPTVFWDLYGKKGNPIRATISDMGPLLLSRLMGLNETQEGVLNIAFAVADRVRVSPKPLPKVWYAVSAARQVKRWCAVSWVPCLKEPKCPAHSRASTAHH